MGGPDGSDRGARDDRAGKGAPHRAVVLDLASSVGTVLAIALFLFAISGVWPPMVAVESASMEPNVDTGDLVVVVEEHRFAPSAQTGETGVVTARTGEQPAVTHRRFGRPGDVVVFEPAGNERATPVIHRAMFWVEAGENWYPKARRGALPGGASGCADLAYCPAPNAGFVTKGDNNGRYDQVRGSGAATGPVKPEWVVGTAEVRIPELGRLRLRFGLVGPVGVGPPS